MIKWQDKTCEKCIYRVDSIYCRINPISLGEYRLGEYPIVKIDSGTKENPYYWYKDSCSKYEETT